MRVIPFEEKYRDKCHEICIHTGSPDNLVNEEHRKFSLLMYCDPYLDHGKCFLLQDDQGEIQGYILCAESYASFKEYIQEYFEEIKKVAPSFVLRCDISEYEAYQKNIQHICMSIS